MIATPIDEPALVFWEMFDDVPTPLLPHAYAHERTPMDTSAASGRRLLIVDDDDGIRSLMEAIFKPLAIDVDFAGDGQRALNQIRLQDYDAIVLDLMMPEVNGFELIRELKKVKPSLLPRTLVLTAAVDPSLRDFDDRNLVGLVMRKPFDLGTFVEAVLTCCSAPLRENEQPAAVGRDQTA